MTVGEGKIYSNSESFLSALLQAVILCKVDELLSEKGIFKFSWLSMSVNGLAILFLTLPGGGKTSLALDLLKISDFKLLSDTYTVVTSTGEVLPFPLDLYSRGDMLPEIPQAHQELFNNSFHGHRVTIDIDYFRDKLAGSCRPYIMAVCKRIFSQKARIEKLSKWKTVLFVYQQALAKYRFYQSDGFLIPENRKSSYRRYLISIKRTLVAIKTLWKSQTFLLYLGVNKGENARIVSEFIQKRIQNGN
jgi:hypothetical protein